MNKHSIEKNFVAKILNDNKAVFEFDASLNDLRGVRNGTLRFDFIVKKNDKIAVIEYNGIFHYHIIQGKTSMYTLSKQQMNDIIKHDYCRRNKIPILWIPYWMNNVDIRNATNFFLFKHKMI